MYGVLCVDLFRRERLVCSRPPPAPEYLCLLQEQLWAFRGLLGSEELRVVEMPGYV